MDLERPIVDTDTARPMLRGELERVIAASGSVLLPPIIWLAVETAMRRSEIVRLRWEHIDLERLVAHVPETKNGSARDVPLSSKAVELLLSLWDKLDNKERGRGLVFDIRADAITRAFERAAMRAREAYEDECKGEGGEASR